MTTKSGKLSILEILFGLSAMKESEFIDVGSHVEKGDRVLGQMSPIQKALATAIEQMGSHLQVDTPVDLGEMGDRLVQFGLLRDIFFDDLQGKFLLGGDEVLGIRKGGMVVAVKETSSLMPSLIPVLTEILGRATAVVPVVPADCGDPNCPLHGHLHRLGWHLHGSRSRSCIHLIQKTGH